VANTVYEIIAAYRQATLHILTVGYHIINTIMGIFDSIKRKLGTDIKNNNGVNEENWISSKASGSLKEEIMLQL